MRTLSKSKLVAFRQCPKRLRLEIHRPKLRADSFATQASFAVGHQVGDIAQRLYDPKGKGGVLIDPQAEGFEAGFRADGALAFADVMMPVKQGSKRTWRMVEVKSFTSVKDYHGDDAAVQALLARTCGVPLSAIALAHIDSAWVYPGADDYDGFLLENDLTDEAFGRSDEVRGWIAEAQQIVAKKKVPAINTGSQCTGPYEYGFLAYCQGLEPQAEQPVSWLPRIGNKLAAHIKSNRVIELRDIPDALLNDQQRRVKEVALSGKDPSQAFAEALLAACGERGPIFVCNAGFETARIRELAERFPRLAKALLALNERVVDLLPVAREHYYHSSQQGSWSIKAVLPAICPDLNYGDLDGVQDGGMAMEAFLEALSPQASATRKAEIERQLLDYCALDTYAMVRLWSTFTGKAVN